MDGVIFEDVRHILLGLLFLLAFGWMAALALPGGNDGMFHWQQEAAADQSIPAQS